MTNVEHVSALDLLTGDAQVFREKIWASRVHLHQVDPATLVGKLSLDDVDHLLTSTAMRTPAMRMAKDGQVLPESRYTRGATLAGRPLTGLVDARKVFAELDDGASVVLQGLHRYWPPLRDLVAQLELELGHPCQANAYLTPPHSQGFAVHSDSHDVIVFQTAGRKVWEVHEAPDGDPDGPREAREVVLEPGVAMYLPTGTPHAARAQDELSLHVTIGINQLTWNGLVRRSVAPLLDAIDDGHLPAGFADDPALLREGLALRLELLADQLRGLDPATVAEAEASRVLTSRVPHLRGGLTDRLGAPIEDDTVLVRRTGRPCVLRDNPDADDRVDLLLGDRVVTLPSWLRPALEAIRGAQRLRPADLGELDPPLDPQSRVVLCRRLVREGLLTRAGA
ncbi:hypothetical protein J2S59_001328 [Nocardioides massiliensis]|uniref:JmjC domain-containing protein n=2 Tax=Nocardioides massiliensis TaxID=1325935 RepID=A0ABT9NMT7_9ACTN|nr:cupin domain-containing protein [Nocardioides massiliensis]MDP9821519.1 hypothetical protein [Nocardioides massiliensis]